VLAGKQHCATAPGTLWSRVSSGPAAAALPATRSPCGLVLFLQRSRSVGAVRPEAERLLVCSCGEFKQLQRMDMDMSPQHSSKRSDLETVCWCPWAK